uniref:Uncharacterized protein n=1 Tax=Rhizophora mucronata TaxID=61149 RepID=A0A2P2QUS7_RHIMU
MRLSIHTLVPKNVKMTLNKEKGVPVHEILILLDIGKNQSLTLVFTRRLFHNLNMQPSSHDVVTLLSYQGSHSKYAPNK